MTKKQSIHLLAGITVILCFAQAGQGNDSGFTSEIRQITFGPKHTFFGYIGHVRTIPWNRGGRYILALRSEFQDRMPGPEDAAEIVLLDARKNFEARVVDRTRAWNFQQGTMLYWNPAAPETQFFFNDRDPKTRDVFCAVFDIAKGRRIAEYRYADTPIGNSGVAQRGGWFLGINYGRLARLRPVTGYPSIRDWSADRKHPADDGIFKVNPGTKEKRLLVSYARMAEAVRASRPDVDEKDLFVNHTLWSRDDGRICFFVRGDFEVRGKRLDIPFTMKADGSDLRALAMHIGGHPEWESGTRMIGARDGEQILFDIERQAIVGRIGSPEIIPNPGGDIALSPDGTWFVNGHGEKGKNYYNILRRADGAWIRTAGVDQGGYITGELRIDPSPCWNREGTQLLVGGVAADAGKTRQLFLIDLKAEAAPRGVR
ncbi:MAG: hypothetical protein ACKVX9_09945 [Blastocatellia bacterium]